MKKRRNIYFDLFDAARECPRAAAIFFEGTAVSYATLDSMVEHTAGIISERSISSQSPVGVTFHSPLMRCIVTLALIRLGVTFVSLPRSMTNIQRNACAEATNVRVNISDNKKFDVIKCRFELIDISQLKFPKKRANIAETVLSPLTIAAGSGSTGTPKLIPQTNDDLSLKIDRAFPENAKSPSAVLSFTNLEFPSGLNRLLSCIRKRIPYCLDELSPDLLCKYINTFLYPTIFSSVFHVEKLLAWVKGNDDFRRNTFKLRLSGSHVSAELRQRVKTQLTEDLSIVYGANECGRISFVESPDIYSEMATVGKPLSGVKVEIVDRTGISVAQGQPGMLRVKSSGMIQGYLNNPEATAKYFRDGWFYPGDIAMFTASGEIRLMGRADRVMIYNGINIHAEEIEAVALSYLGIEDVFVFSLNNRQSGNIPGLLFSSEFGSEINLTEFSGFLAQRLGFKQPRKLIPVESIPRSETGKVKRSAIYELLENL